jgi:8-oxo-dGTP diphosphatase
MSHTYSYPRPAVTVDCVLFGFRPDAADLQVLLIERADEPHEGAAALPGGFVEVRDGGDQGEDLEAAARRELLEETGVKVDYLEQLYTFGKPGRDPRGRVITVAYIALVRSTDHAARAGSDAAGASWVSLRDARARVMAFDHREILDMAVARLRGKVRYAPLGFALLPERFTMPELRSLYETILDAPLDRGNFRNAVLRLGVLKKVGQRKGNGAGRAPDLYQFDKRAYDRATREGISFDPVPDSKGPPRVARAERKRR